MIPVSPDGLSPPPYCRCHRFIFYPLFTEPLFRPLTVPSSGPTDYVTAPSPGHMEYDQLDPGRTPRHLSFKGKHIFFVIKVYCSSMFLKGLL